MFTLALIQMQMEGGNAPGNLRRADGLIDAAAHAGADLALLPEALDLGWTHPSACSLASPIPHGDTCQRLIRAARRNKMYVCAGLIERDHDRVFNAAVIINPQGAIILHHRKLNELDIGHAYYDQGDRLNVCHTDLGTLGLMICADGFAQGQVLSRALGYMGADVILSPGSWAVPADHDNTQTPYGQEWRDAYIPVARDFSIWIAGVSNVGWLTAGPWAGWKCIGCSLVIGPDGGEVIQGPYGVEAETIIYVDVEPVPRPARGTDWQRHWQSQAP